MTVKEFLTANNIPFEERPDSEGRVIPIVHSDKVTPEQKLLIDQYFKTYHNEETNS